MCFAMEISVSVCKITKIYQKKTGVENKFFLEVLDIVRASLSFV